MTEMHQHVSVPRIVRGKVARAVAGVAQDDYVRLGPGIDLIADALGMGLETFRHLKGHGPGALGKDEGADLVQFEVVHRVALT
jgi:hypothetical protein